MILNKLIQKFFIIVSGIVVGAIVGYLFIFNTPKAGSPSSTPNPSVSTFIPSQNQVVGFLPFWLLDKAKSDYSKYITTLSYCFRSHLT